MEIRHLAIFGPEDQGAYETARLFSDFDEQEYVEQEFVSEEKPLLVTYLNCYTEYQALFEEIARRADFFLLVVRFNCPDFGEQLDRYPFLLNIDPNRTIVLNSNAEECDEDTLQAERVLGRCGIKFTKIITRFEESAVRDAVQ